MTKYEWEHELKKNIHRLPSDEISRVLDYYNEMFEDNIERGKSEREIIREFGNPVDVADKILSEYDGELLPVDKQISVPTDIPTSKNSSSNENGTFDSPFAGHDCTVSDDDYVDKNVADCDVECKTPAPDEHRKPDKTNKRNLRVALFLAFNIITGFAFVIVAVALLIVLASLTIASIGIGVGGVYVFIVSFGPMFSGAVGSGLAHLGIGIACFGLGVLLLFGFVKLIRLYGVAAKTIFNVIFKVAQKETA